MTSLRKRLGLLAATATVAAVALTGCASGSSPSPSASSTSLPDSSQNLTYIPSAFPLNLDIPANPAEIGVNAVVSQVLQPLVKFDGKKATADLATSWTWTDPTTLKLTLRKGVTFSDGKAFTAADVKASFDVYIAANSPAFSAQFAPIMSTAATDDHTFTITTSQPVGTLVNFLSFVYIGEAGKVTQADYWNKPVGTGPFKVTEYVPNDHVALARNDSYWGTKAKLKTLTFKKVSDVSSKVTALSNNEAQVVGDVPSDQIDSVKAIDGVKLQTADSYSYFFVWFENSKSPLNNVKVRKAMFEALDIPTIAKSLYGNTASAMDSFCPPTAFGCTTAKLPSYNPKDAKKLLADAGYPKGFSTDIIFSTVNGSNITDLAPALISSWKAIGVTVTPRGEDQATWLADFSALNWQQDLQVNQTLTGDADYTLNRLYSCAAKRLGYCNPSLDTLLTKAQQSTDQTERLGLYKQATTVLEKDLPFIPLLNLKVNDAVRSNVKGLSIPPTEFIDFSSVYLH
jgi:peptide/nickel transport system substrate-binding protein